MLSIRNVIFESLRTVEEYAIRRRLAQSNQKVCEASA